MNPSPTPSKPRTGFQPPVPPRRVCFADALTGLTQLSKVGKRLPAKAAPHPSVAPRHAILRPTRHRIGGAWRRVGMVGLAGVAVAAIWQLVDHRSLFRRYFASFRLRLREQLGLRAQFRTSLPPVIRRKSPMVRR